MKLQVEREKVRKRERDKAKEFLVTNYQQSWLVTTIVGSKICGKIFQSGVVDSRRLSVFKTGKTTSDDGNDNDKDDDVKTLGKCKMPVRSVQSSQCDQMEKLFLQYLAI